MTLAFVSCSVFRHYEPEPLVNKRNNYNGTAINVGGYYQGKNTKMVYVFFRNGVIRGGMRFPFTSPENLESEILKVLKDWKTMPDNWGAFTVLENKNIAINEWVNIGSWFGDFPQIVKKGEIIDNATFVLKIDPYPSEKNIRSEVDTFYFYPMTIKPDSTNKYSEQWYR